MYEFRGVEPRDVLPELDQRSEQILQELIEPRLNPSDSGRVSLLLTLAGYRPMTAASLEVSRYTEIREYHELFQDIPLPSELSIWYDTETGEAGVNFRIAHSETVLRRFHEYQNTETDDVEQNPGWVLGFPREAIKNFGVTHPVFGCGVYLYTWDRLFGEYDRKWAHLVEYNPAPTPKGIAQFLRDADRTAQYLREIASDYPQYETVLEHKGPVAPRISTSWLVTAYWDLNRRRYWWFYLLFPVFATLCIYERLRYRVTELAAD